MFSLLTGYLILNEGPELFNVTVSSVSVCIGDPSTNGKGIPATYMLQYVVSIASSFFKVMIKWEQHNHINILLVKLNYGQ